MAQLTILTPAQDSDVLPALTLLSHRIHVLPAEIASLMSVPDAELVLVDACHDLVAAKTLTKLVATTAPGTPIMLVVTEGGLAAVNSDWGVGDVVLTGAGPAEVDARIRLAIDRPGVISPHTSVQASGITIDDETYSAKLLGHPLDLTFREFELLRFFVMHPGRVFTRDQLLTEVWGFDYYGGTRTVDVHIRRLRTKLDDNASLIGTVRNVGYRLTVSSDDGSGDR